MNVTISQDSTIGDGSSSPFVAYTGVRSVTATAGQITAMFAQGSSTFSLLFELTTPMTLVHTFPVGVPNFACELDPSAPGPTINLLAIGANNLALDSGRYTLSIDTSALVTNSNFSSMTTLSGTVSLIPTSLGTGPMTLCMLAMRRPRRSIARI